MKPKRLPDNTHQTKDKMFTSISLNLKEKLKAKLASNLARKAESKTVKKTAVKTVGRKESSVSTEEINRIATIVKKAKDAYYNSDSFYAVPKSVVSAIEKLSLKKTLTRDSEVNDKTYDLIEDYLKEIAPNHKILSVGADLPIKKEKVKLPFSMPSLNKKKPDNLEDWLTEHTGMYVISDKIDGVSLGIQFDGTGERKLFTRGNGSVGGDISFLADALGIPRIKKKMSVRAEVVMPLEMFKKWEKDFANPRNMVSGITNRNSVHGKALGNCKVLAYQILSSNDPQSIQLKELRTLGFSIPWYKEAYEMSVAKMSKWLEERKANAKYEVDGLVIARNIKAVASRDNPEHMVAFKNNDTEEHVDATVVEVQWRHTRTGILFPRVMIKPVKLKGVTVTYASGKSGMVIKNLKIGPGAIISIARSGDVIPDIRAVVKPAKTASLPDVAYNIQGEHFFAEGEAENAVVQYLEFFFAQLGIENFKAATLTKVVDEGYDSVAKIYKLSKKKLVDLTSKRGEKIHDEIHGLGAVELATLMYASQQFGRAMGSRRLESIVKNIPDVLTKTHKNLSQKIDDIPGFDVTTANMFTMNLQKFKDWLKDCPFDYVLEHEKEILGSKCKNHKVMFTGFRDAGLQEIIESQGGEVITAIGKATHLLASDPSGDSAKLKTARAKDITIMSRTQYLEKYKI